MEYPAKSEMNWSWKCHDCACYYLDVADNCEVGSIAYSTHVA